MFGSIQVGVSEVRSEHFFICDGDMPCVFADIYQQVWSEWGDHTVFSGTKEKPGHSVLLPKSIIPAIQRSEIDGKMKPLIMVHKVRFLGLDLLDIYLDVDTPAAYHAVCESAQIYHSYQFDSCCINLIAVVSTPLINLPFRTPRRVEYTPQNFLMCSVTNRRHSVK